MPLGGDSRVALPRGGDDRVGEGHLVAALSNKRGLLYLVDKPRLHHHHAAAASKLQSYLGKFKVVHGGGGAQGDRPKRSLLAALDDGAGGAGGDDLEDEGDL